MAQITIEDAALTATFEGTFDAAPEDSLEIVEQIAKTRPRCVTLICDLASPGSTWPAALSGRSLPSVTAFIFDTYFQTLTRQATNDPGDLAATLAAFPNLERVFASGQLELTACTHAAVEKLHLLGDPLSEDLFAALARCRFPRLETLVLALASDAGPGPEAEAFRAIAALDAPLLREVHVAGGESIESALAASQSLPHHVANLGIHARIDDEDELLEIVERHAAQLQRFTSIVLPFADYCSDEALDRARAIVFAMTDAGDRADPTLPAAYSSWR